MNERIPRVARSAAWRANFIEANGYRCHYCNRPGGPAIGPDARPWHVDHKNPLADGGEDADANLALACKRCNIAKGTQPYSRFKAFAGVAFWNESREPATESALDDLLVSWAATAQGIWSYAVPEVDDGDVVISCRPSGEINNSADDVVASIHRVYGRGDKQGHAAEFIVRAHRLIPDLIAEIRTLRAELADVRANEAPAA